jgi:hypothetical protein
MAATRRRQRKSSDASSTPKLSRINWDNPRTDRLIDWLEENPSERHKLFADSIQDAQAEGHARNVAKTSKTTFYSAIAEAVFSVDADLPTREDYANDKSRYARGVENRIGL